MSSEIHASATARTGVRAVTPCQREAQRFPAITENPLPSTNSRRADPAIRMEYPTMFRAAADGETRAARQLIELMIRAETERTGSVFKMLQGVVQYKESLVRFSNNASARAFPLRIYSPTPTMSLSMKPRGSSPSTGREPRNKLAH